jgi:hypothetical protein
MPTAPLPATPQAVQLVGPDKLERNRAKLENSRGSHELNWVAGIDTRGVVFLWVRNSFCFEVVSPRGVSPIARFLGDFPY